LSDPLKGVISWAVPDNHTVSVTLFKDPRTHELEDKDWSFVIEDVRSVAYIDIFTKEHNAMVYWYIVSFLNRYRRQEKDVMWPPQI